MSYLLSFCRFDVPKNFAFGVGVGVGVGVVIRKLFQEKRKQQDHLISCLKQLAAEVRQLRETLLKTVGEHVSRNNTTSNVIQLGNESSDEDEYFDTEKDESGDDLSSFFAKIDSLQEGTMAEQQHAYNLLIVKANQNMTNVDVLWRLAKSQLQVANLKEQAGDDQAEKLMLSKGIETGKKALNVDDTSFDAHKWYAVLTGKNIKYLNNKEKILSGYEYKKHIEIAIDLNPDDANCHHFLGRYYFEIYMLPWYMRKAAAALFAEPPTATLDDALSCFMKAESYDPGFWADNAYYIGKCHYENSEYTLAKEWLNKAIESDKKKSNQTKSDAMKLLGKC